MTLANSANIPSPITLTIRPRCSFIFGSMTVPQSAFHCERVPSSSASTSRLYPAISAARMALSRRSMRSLAKHPSYSLSTVIQGSLRLSVAGGQGTNVTLVLKRASASRPSGEWNDDDFDVLADCGARDALRESGPRSWLGSELARGLTCWPGEPRSRWGHRGHIRYSSHGLR